MNEPPRPEVAVFAAALELPAAQRGAYLDQACAGDSALRGQVEALLRVHDAAGNFFDKLASVAKPGAEGQMPGSSGTIRLPSIPSEKPGDKIGRYKLLQQIGEGGCGVVYMAEQEEPVRRRVALKVIKLGMDTKTVIARFEAERQALALMDHPNIAKVLEAGATDTGRPYFVMELVRGIKITDYCDENNLSTSARLELFIQVCQAIQHAHQKGVIHRDIKPSNILVADHDGTPVPKIIDFGIAKATTDQRLTDKTLFTAFEQFIGTPAYMSPEQAKLSGLDIDTRSDIYSLGVLLYELLAGSTPFDAKELMSSGLDAMRKIIREQEPVRPSIRFATLQAADLTTTAKRRSTDTPKLLHQLRGDLDWIVMKCLEKDRTRRYETANGLAMDIQRHLQNELVLARPPSVGYKFQRLVRRNKLAFTALAAVTAALIIGLGVAIWSFFIEQQALHQAEAERKTAKTEAAKATAISDFFQQSLRAANPDERKSSEYTVRQLLDDYAAGLEGQFTNQPEVEAAVRVTIGKAYYRLGAGDKAQPHLERALVLNRKLYGEHEQVAATLADCAWASFEQKDPAKAELQARAALEIYRKDGTVGQPVLFALWALQQALNIQNRIADSIVVGEQALDMARKTPNMEYPETASILHALAESKNGQSKFAEGETLARQAVEMHRRLQGSQHPETGWALVALGQALGAQNKLDEAERADREALNIFRRQFLSGNKSVDSATFFLRAVLEAKGDLPGLVGIDQTTLADQRSVLGENSPAVALTLSTLAGHLRAEGKQAEAERAYRDALALEGKLPGEEAALAANSSALAELLRRSGRMAEAGALAREAAQKCHALMAQYEKLASDSNRYHDSWGFAISYEAMGEILDQTGQTQEAEKAYLDAQALWRKLVADFDSEDHCFHLAVNYDALGNVLRETGRATESLAAYRAAQAIWAKLVADFNVEDHRVHLGWTDENISQLLKESGRFDEATESYRQALAVWKEVVADFNKDDYREGLSETVIGLAATLQTAGQRTEAAEFIIEAAGYADAQTLNGLAWLLATGPDPKFRDGTNAVAFAEKAAAATQRKNVSYLDTLAAAYAETGQFAKAVSIQQEAIALSQSDDEKKGLASRLKLYESHSPYRDDGALAVLAGARLNEGKFAEAEGLARECLTLREIQIPDDWRTFNAQSMLGGSLLGQKKYAEAEPLLLSGYEGMKQREVTIPPEGKVRLNETLQRLAQLYEATQRPDQAVEWRKKLAELEPDKK